MKRPLTLGINGCDVGQTALLQNALQKGPHNHLQSVPKQETRRGHALLRTPAYRQGFIVRRSGAFIPVHRGRSAPFDKTHPDRAGPYRFPRDGRRTRHGRHPPPASIRPPGSPRGLLRWFLYRSARRRSGRITYGPRIPRQLARPRRRSDRRSRDGPSDPHFPGRRSSGAGDHWQAASGRMQDRHRRASRKKPT